MASNSSATTREQTPHATDDTFDVNRATRTATIINALKRRAQSVLNDETIDAQSRAIIRYALETNDPWLAELVRRADARETICNATEFSQTPEIAESDSRKERIEALAEIICRAGDQPAAALIVLMGTLQNSSNPEVLANTAKHIAFTRCGELNVDGIVDTHVELLADKLLASNSIQH